MKTAYREWEIKIEKDIAFWNSQEGIELSLNAIEQGYKENLFYILLPLFGSGFMVLGLVKSLEEKYLK